MKFETLLKTLLVILTVACSTLFSSISAQDQIVLKTGEKYDCDIVEVNDIEIKYREYNDPDGIIFTIPRGKIREVRYASGKRQVEQAPMLDEAYYVDDAKHSLKVNFFAIANATTILVYEYGLSPGSSLEASLKINGLGINNEEEKSGVGLDLGYKVKLGSVFKNKGAYRPKHFLAGGYFRPSIGFNAVSLDAGYDYDSYFYVQLGFDIGIQWIIQNAVALDFYIGTHYYGGNFDDTYTGDSGSGGFINDGNMFGGENFALSIGMNVGGVFGKRNGGSKKSKNKRRGM